MMLDREAEGVGAAQTVRRNALAAGRIGEIHGSILGLSLHWFYIPVLKRGKNASA